LVLNYVWITAPANWGGICKTGHAQSPINFKQGTISHSRHLRRIRVNQAYLQAYPEFYVKNNGHTGNNFLCLILNSAFLNLFNLATQMFEKSNFLVQVQLREDLTSSLRVDSDGFRGTKYQLSQLHFHWGSKDDRGSEHTINETR